MKRMYHLLLVVSIAIITVKCQKELSMSSPYSGMENGKSSPVISTLHGSVLDEAGNPAIGVKVSAGSKTAITDPHGYFRITDAMLDKNSSFVTAEQPGYFKAFRSFRATTGVNLVVIKLTKKILAGSVSASTGGEVTMPNGAKIFLPANSMSSPSSATFAGNVQVYAAYIDPTSREINKTIPGSLMADDKDNNRVVLASYGMLAVELQSETGEKLQIAAGSAATLTMPIPSSLLSSAPATISLWYIDEQTGIWKEQGRAEKKGDNYIGQVGHFSYWNCDSQLPAISFTAILTSSSGMPIPNLYVSIRPLNEPSFGYAHGYTDSIGEVSGLIPANRSLLLEVFNHSYNVVYAKTIGPFTGNNTNLGTIVISDTVPSLVNVKGKLLSCNNIAVSNGYVIMYWNNLATYVSLNSNGEFSTNILSPVSTPLPIELLGIDKAAQQQSSLLTIPVTPGVTNAGNIQVCGASSAQFINYTLDGIKYSFSDLPYDSSEVFAFGTTYDTYIQGYQLPANQINFNFTNDMAAGVYPMKSLAVANYNRVGLANPFNVILTNYPQQAEDFYEGSFSGAFLDSSNVSVTHNISASFRVRRR